MFKRLSASLLVATLSTGLYSGATLAEGWEFLPVIDDDYEYKPQLSLIAGTASIDGSSESMSGVELAINCPLVKAPNAVIRQQISYATIESNGTKLKSFELNPHYMVVMSDKVQVGFGPGIGYLSADATGLSDSAITLQAGANVLYTAGKFTAGLELRHQVTVGSIKTNTGTDVDVDNTRFMAKVGYRF